jgi:hypothetical protein
MSRLEGYEPMVVKFAELQNMYFKQNLTPNPVGRANIGESILSERKKQSLFSHFANSEIRGKMS